MLNMKKPPGAAARQNGIALLLSLVMLLVLTALGVSSVQNAILAGRMSRSALDTGMAFQSAEVALREAESHIEEGIGSPAEFDAAGAADRGLYVEAAWDETPNWATGVWDAQAGYRTATAAPGVAQPARYIIERLGAVTPHQASLNLDNIGQETVGGRVDIFRVTALGTGGTANARAMIQSTYGKEF